jgi:hypothetical protein
MDHIDHNDAASGEGSAAYEAMPSFLAGLTQAMHDTATREHGHMADIVAQDARKHVELAHARATIEADALRRLADDDIEAIEVWSADEIARLREEADDRKKQRRADLESYLDRHAMIIDAEVAGVDFALAEYQATLDAFIEGLLASNDASDIARRAGMMPAAPDLDRARAQARAAAIAKYADPDADGPGLGVMDPSSIGRPDGLAMAVDPLQAPDEDLVVIATTPATAEPVSASNRLFRVLGQWMAAPDPKRQDAARKG